MFERYTEKARRVIFFARYEASQFGSPYIESEHLLLGLLREDKELTNRFLGRHSMVESIRKQIEEHTEIREKTATSVDLPLANDCKRILAYAAEEAMRLSHKHIGTEHLLLGILREEQCFAAQILSERGIKAPEVREQLQKYPAPVPVRSESVRRPPADAPAPLVFALADGEVLLRYQNLPLPVPRIGETIAIGPPGQPTRRYRVQDVAWTFVAPAPEPEEIAEARKRVDATMERAENAIANHEFDKARVLHDEERKERDRLRGLLTSLGRTTKPETTETLQPLQEIRITLIPAADSSL